LPKGGNAIAGDHKFTVTVVVAGVPHEVSVKPNQKVEHLIKEALKEAKIKHPNLEEWKLRFATGGEAIDPGEKIDKAGITAGSTLFLDPEEGGGGQVAVALQAPEEPPAPPVLVDPAVSAAKLVRQLADWEAGRAFYEDRGCWLLGSGELHVDLAFNARLPITPNNDLTATVLAVRIGFENYDVWAPSVRVIDPITRRWLQVARVGAPDFENSPAGGPPINLFVDNHPETGHVFLCKRGVREYHRHPEHSGDDWLLYRDQGFGTLGGLCDLLWRVTARTVTGLNFAAQRIPSGDAAFLNFGVEVRQENVDQLTAQLPQPVGADQIPPEMQAQLQAALAQAQAQG
jgi:Predicted metal binding domain